MGKNYQNLVEKGLLKKEKIDYIQIRKIIKKARNDLKSAKILLKNGQSENSYELAYGAMLSAGRAMVFSRGFRPRTQGSHKIVIEFIEKISGKSLTPMIKRFDKMRKKRHYLIYGIGLEISKTEAGNAVQNAEKFVGEVEKAIKNKDPQKELFKIE